MILIYLPVKAQKESADVSSGNKFFKSEKFTEAEIAYRRGLLKNPKSFEANYNLGNALFKQNKFNEAFEQYKNALGLRIKDNEKLAAALHNIGNALLAQNKLVESISAYKMALKANPADSETRYNLAFAQSKLKQQQQQQQQQNKPEKENNQEQNKQDLPNAKNKQPAGMSKERAQQLLDALMQDENNSLEKAKKQQVRLTKSAVKDW